MTHADLSLARYLQGGALRTGRVEAFFPFLDDGKPHVISLVGGGGKTTTMHYLAQAFQRRGKHAAIMTTTKIGRPADWCANMAECRARWHSGQYAVCGTPLGEGKLTAPPADFTHVLLAEADAILIEADGAHRLPCKAPAAHEPVILPESDIVIGVMGLDALGQPVDDICLRADIVQQLLGCDGSHRLTAEDMAALLLSPQGTRKNVGQRAYYTVLNKCDDDPRLCAGLTLLSLLQSHGHTNAVLTTGMRRSEAYEYQQR